MKSVKTSKFLRCHWRIYMWANHLTREMVSSHIRHWRSVLVRIEAISCCISNEISHFWRFCLKAIFRNFWIFLTYKPKYQLIALVVDVIGQFKNIAFLNDYCYKSPKNMQFKRTTHKFQYISHPPWPFRLITWLHSVAILEGEKIFEGDTFFERLWHGLIIFALLPHGLLWLMVLSTAQSIPNIAIIDSMRPIKMLIILTIRGMTITLQNVICSIYQKGRTISYHNFLFTDKALKVLAKSQI